MTDFMFVEPLGYCLVGIKFEVYILYDICTIHIDYTTKYTVEIVLNARKYSYFKFLCFEATLLVLPTQSAGVCLIFCTFL